MVFTPNLDFSPQLFGLQEGLSSAFAPVYELMALASKLVPTWLLQKVILFLLFFLAGLGAHRLLSSKGAGSYFAGLLYVVNPFTYVRFLAGQWTILTSYALMPFAIKAFLDLLEKGSGKNVIKVAVFSTLVGIFQTQGLFLLLMAFLIIFLAKVIKEHSRPARIIQSSKYVGISASLFLFLNLYWLIPVLTSGETILGQISSQDLFLFAPQPTSTFGVLFDTASMYGFWRGAYVYAMDILPFWWLFFVFILFLAVYGFINRVTIPSLSSSLRSEGEEDSTGGTAPPLDNCMNQRWVVISFGVIWVISLLLAVGIASPATRPVFEWLWDNVFFFRGFRDSQKFVVLLCLTYACLGGLGVSDLVRRFRQQSRKLAKVGVMTVIVLALLTPPIFSFTMFGFYDQLGVTDYPAEWYQTNEYLNQNEDDCSILFLPWHMYMDFSWLPNTDKRLANPAQQFFDKPTIAGDNVEMPGIYSQSTNPISKYVEFLLGHGNDVDNLGELLAPLNVKYVILVHEVDYTNYDFLYHQDDLKVDLEGQGLTLFRNEHPVAKIYGIDSVVYIESVDEYLELSKEQDVMEHLYILGSGPSNGGNGQMQRLNFVEKSPIKYQIEGTVRKYTVFTVPQNVSTEHWEYDGKQPLKNLGFMPAFESDEGGGEIVYTRFYYVYLPSYIISAVALVVLMVTYFNRGKVARLIRRR